MQKKDTNIERGAKKCMFFLDRNEKETYLYIEIRKTFRHFAVCSLTDLSAAYDIKHSCSDISTKEMCVSVCVHTHIVLLQDLQSTVDIVE